MSTPNDKAVSVLNNLITTCKDGENGFRSAAEGVEDASLQQTFAELSSQRATFALELQGEIQKLGGEATDSGSTLAALHRGWLNIKEAVAGREGKAILEECERGEDVAVKAYREAVEGGDLNGDSLNLVTRQQSDVQAAHDRVKALRDAARAAA